MIFTCSDMLHKMYVFCQRWFRFPGLMYEPASQNQKQGTHCEVLPFRPWIKVPNMFLKTGPPRISLWWPMFQNLCIRSFGGPVQYIDGRTRTALNISVLVASNLIKFDNAILCKKWFRFFRINWGFHYAKMPMESSLSKTDIEQKAILARQKTKGMHWFSFVWFRGPFFGGTPAIFWGTRFGSHFDCSCIKYETIFGSCF